MNEAVTVPLSDMHSEIVSLLLCSLWVAAWLNWIFRGEVRHVLIAAFPRRMHAGVSRAKILQMTQDELTVFLCGTSDLPLFFRKLLSCPRCLSAYVSAVGAVVAVIGGLGLIPAILVWAASAWAGVNLHNNTK